MSESCETCKYVFVVPEAFPCSRCKHNYTNQWKKQTYTELVAPLQKLAKTQIDKGNTDAADICAAVMRWIKEEA